MRIKIPRREGTFSPHLNGRTEGSGDGKKTAADLKVWFLGTKTTIDTIVPLVNGVKFSDVMYDQTGRFLCPYMSPLKLHRKPEGLLITIYDGGKKPMQFKKASAKNLEILFHEKRNCEVEMLLQVRPDPDQWQRLARLIAAEKAEFEVVAEQEELFTEEGEEAEEEGGDEAQQDFVEEGEEELEEREEPEGDEDD